MNTLSILNSLPDALGALPNPFDGIRPDISLIGGAAEGKWKRLVAVVWGICFAVLGVMLLFHFTALGTAKKNANPADMDAAQSRLTRTGVAFGCVSCIGIIAGAVIAIAG